MRKNITHQHILMMLKKHEQEIRRYGVKKIGIFGSFLKETQHKGSDIDFLITMSNPTFDNYMELKFLLENMFHKKIDLIIEENLKPALHYIKKEAVYVK